MTNYLLQYLIKYLVLFGILLVQYTQLSATHIRAAELTYRRTSMDFFTYEFTLTGYIDTGSPVRFGDGTINFGDGREEQIDLEANTFQDGTYLGKDNETELYIIKIIHTYVSPGAFRVSYREPNRNDEIVNINKGNSVQVPFYIEALVVIDPAIGANSSPEFQTNPVDRGFVGKTFTHNSWASDPDGDSLSYRLIIPFQDRDQVVPNFEKPDDPDFYLPPLSWSIGNESADASALWELNQFTGDLVWDAPGNLLKNSQGAFSEYNVAFVVEEWRQVQGAWRKIGYVTRDMQIIATGQLIGRPDFQIPEETSLSVNETIRETIVFTDPDDENIKVEFFGEVFDLDNGPMTVTPTVADLIDGPVVLTFEWTPLPEHLRDRPYYVPSQNI